MRTKEVTAVFVCTQAEHVLLFTYLVKRFVGVVQSSFVPFSFVGRVENIGNAKLLLDYQINHLKVCICWTRSLSSTAL